MSSQTAPARMLPLLLAVFAVVAIWLWPGIEIESVDVGLSPVEAYRAAIVDPAPPAPDPGDEFSGYGEVLLRVLEGPRSGEDLRAFVTLQSTEASPQDFEIGDEVILTFTADVQGTAFAAVSERWRVPVLGLLVLIFAVVMVVVGGWQGLRALVALGLTVVLVARFLVPAILDGAAPVPLAVGLAALITVATILLTEGLTRVSLAAILGTTGGLAITAVLASLVSAASAFSGTSAGDIAFVTSASGQSIDVNGILLAAIILGAVGVLDDVTVSQAATVDELAARSRESMGTLWRRGFRIGRSHVAATTNTLFMAYIGAGLPALLFLVLASEPLLLALNREVLALEVVRTLVGSIGIILAMPLTTLIAAALLGSRGPSVRLAPIENEALPGP